MKACRNIEGRIFAYGARHLRTVTLCGIKVPVVEATPEQEPLLKDEDGTLNDGRFDFARGAILIRAGLPADLLRDAVNHETFHGLLYYSGADQYLSGLEGKADHVEQVTRILSPHLAGIRWAK